MLGRIQKKLYLSAKVTESMRDTYNPEGTLQVSRNESDNDLPQLSTGQLMSLVRKGAQTLTRPEININEIIGWSWSTMLEKCKDTPAEADSNASTLTGDANEMEQNWLSQVEQVQSRIFDGKKHKVSGDSREIAQEWAREERRVGKNTTVTIDGYAVSKESLSCGDWEAVPTMAGKDPRLAEPKRDKKPPINNQSVSCYPWL